MLDAAELAGIRETSEANLPDVCAVVDIEEVRDEFGDVEEVAVTGPDFACRVSPLATGSRQSDVEAVIMDRLGVIEAWRIVAAREIDVGLEDKILVDVEGHTRLLEVAASPGPKSYEAVHRFVATEVK
jgi:hypothetical protein